MLLPPHFMYAMPCERTNTDTLYTISIHLHPASRDEHVFFHQTRLTSLIQGINAHMNLYHDNNTS